ncbi:peregrin-like [Planoprotostelium fungivorum]|uniref:Peregrin-like n=1 Tax=Planoprotostelium fungivorum TaxID=1890364 RepID=A0A2P6MVM9_9EUKA|nr:peregrin-like [Planoprotostelium fungivorum]
MTTLLRSRAIDVNTKLEIVTDAARIKEMEEHSGLFGDVTPQKKKRKKHDTSDAEEELSTGVIKESGSIVVPIPGVRVLARTTAASPGKRFKPPSDYYVHKEINGEDKKKAEYDADEEDEEFIAAVNQKHGNNAHQKLSVDFFEVLIEIFEIEFNSARFMKEPHILFGFSDDGDTNCNVCHGNSNEEENPLLFCETCHVHVHRACYGVEDEEEHWKCDRCLSPNKSQITCALCPSAQGALKETEEEGTWVHLCCALWTPQIIIEDTDSMDGISTPSSISSKVARHTCMVCDHKSGLSVRCKESKCNQHFHITCGRHEGFKIDVESNEKFSQYCRKHTIAREVKKEDSFGFTCLDEQQQTHLHSVIQLYSPNYFAFDERKTQESKTLLSKTYLFWRWKRSRHRTSLLRVFLQRPDEKNRLNLRNGLTDREYRVRCFRLRQDLDRLRTLLDLCKKRESIKKERIKWIETEVLLRERRRMLEEGKGKKSPGKLVKNPPTKGRKREKKGEKKNVSVDRSAGRAREKGRGGQSSEEEKEEEKEEEEKEEEEQEEEKEEIEEKEEEGEEEKEIEEREEIEEEITDDDVEVEKEESTESADSEEEESEEEKEEEEKEEEEKEEEEEEEILKEESSGEEEIEEQEEEQEEEEIIDDDSPRKNAGKTPVKKNRSPSPQSSAPSSPPPPSPTSQPLKRTKNKKRKRKSFTGRVAVPVKLVSGYSEEGC